MELLAGERTEDRGKHNFTLLHQNYFQTVLHEEFSLAVEALS